MNALTDYHIHTKWCHHAIGEMEDYVAKAIELQMKEIGFADHAPGTPDYDPRHRMTIDQFHHYADQVNKLDKQVTGLSIKLGMETDFYPGFEDALRQMYKQFPIDYAIGSVHYVGDVLVFSADQSVLNVDDQKQYIRGYFDLLKQGILSQLVHVVAHMDVLKYPFPHLKKMIDEESALLLPLIAEHGLAIELNTSGWRRRPNECYPSPVILNEAARYNIPVCLSSDAHKPEEVGFDFERAKVLLTDMGYTKTEIHACGIEIYKRLEDCDHDSNGTF